MTQITCYFLSSIFCLIGAWKRKLKKKIGFWFL